MCRLGIVILIASAQLTVLCMTVDGQGVLERLEKKVQDVTAPPLEPPLSTEQRGYLGLVADEAKRDTGTAVIVLSVSPTGPAGRAGIKAGDEIVSINGRPMGSLKDMDRAVQVSPGTHLEFQIHRGSAFQRIRVTVAAPPTKAGELPSPAVEPAEAPSPTGRPSIVEGNRPTLGISVVDVSDATRRLYRLTVRSGAVITDVREGTPAARVGLPIGGVIVAVDGRRIGSANDLVATIQTYKPEQEMELTYFEGDRLGRKRIRLGRSAAAAVRVPPRVPAPIPSAPRVTAPLDPPLRMGRGGEDRPLLRRLEETLDRIAPRPAPPIPDAGSPPAAELPPPPPPPGTSDDLIALRQQIEAMRQQIKQLQERIDQMEKKLQKVETPKKTSG